MQHDFVGVYHLRYTEGDSNTSNIPRPKSKRPSKAKRFSLPHLAHRITASSCSQGCMVGEWGGLTLARRCRVQWVYRLRNADTSPHMHLIEMLSIRCPGRVTTWQSLHFSWLALPGKWNASCISSLLTFLYSTSFPAFQLLLSWRVSSMHGFFIVSVFKLNIHAQCITTVFWLHLNSKRCAWLIWLEYRAHSPNHRVFQYYLTAGMRFAPTCFRFSPDGLQRWNASSAPVGSVRLRLEAPKRRQNNFCLLFRLRYRGNVNAGLAPGSE